MKDIFILTGIALVAFAVAGVFFMFGMGQQHTHAPVSENIPYSKNISQLPHMIAQGTKAPINTRINYLINSRSKLKQLWSLIYESNAVPIPSIDFSKYNVAAVFAGIKPTVGYSIMITSILDTAKKQIAIVTITHPGPSCTVGPPKTSPYEIALIPKPTLPLSHTYIIKTSFCK